MFKTLEYQGFKAVVEHNIETGDFRGRAKRGANDEIIFSTKEAVEILNSFHKAVVTFLSEEIKQTQKTKQTKS